MNKDLKHIFINSIIKMNKGYGIQFKRKRKKKLKVKC